MTNVIDLGLADRPQRKPSLAKEPTPHEGGHIFHLSHPDDIAAVARTELYPRDGKPGNLRYLHNQWYKVTDNLVWVPLSNQTVVSDVRAWMRSQFIWRKDEVDNMPTTLRTQGEIVAALRDQCYVAEAPSYIGRAMLELLDGREVVDPLSCDRLPDTYTEEDFIRAPLPFTRAQVAGAPAPVKWLKFLQDGFTLESIILLQEFFGYCLTGDTSLDKFLWVQGLGKSGKSTTLRMLELLLGGIDRVAPMDNESLNNFNADMSDKRLLHFADYRAGKNDGRMMKLCLIVAGGDTVRIEPKGVDARAERTTAKIAVSSNEWPLFSDTSGAIARRLVPLKRTKPNPFVENTDLEAELTAELPGILAWAVEGLRRLNVQRKFSEHLIDQTILRDVAKMLDAMITFIDTRLVLSSKERTERSVLMDTWKSYAKEKNIYLHTQDATIHRLIHAVEQHHGVTLTANGNVYVCGVRPKNAKEIAAAHAAEKLAMEFQS